MCSRAGSKSSRITSSADCGSADVARRFERDVAGAQASEAAARRDLAQQDSQIASKSKRVDTMTREVEHGDRPRIELQLRVDESTHSLAQVDQHVTPAEAQLAETEKSRPNWKRKSPSNAPGSPNSREHTTRRCWMWSAVVPRRGASKRRSRMTSRVVEIVAEIKIVDDAGDNPSGAARAILPPSSDLPQQLRASTW